ncbi:A/G-specific adenine glycosylase [uncultured Cohaesibacter sp.]|uniref:A/G-specific adenine glycosylase n=1 Tax=uncultured Cohaesibacter sp. TaxID=1002546 RepID=UPI0029C95AAB|nr:A/G-specific adenine glycosylase [uncultured Cohaesibacter sp.]
MKADKGFDTIDMKAEQTAEPDSRVTEPSSAETPNAPAGTWGVPDAAALLDWYDRHHRDLPWRVSPPDAAVGVVADPYHVWISEIMLQQTTVGAVRAYFEKFLTLWPTVDDLAAAEEDDILKAWAGLGYYSRARNLHKCARAVVDEHGGRFPATAEELKQLPGIGDYTSAAIAAIAFDEPVAVVDGNIERIISRLYRISDPLPAAKKPIREKMASLMPDDRPGDFAQGMMDLGASLCSPKRPACSLCPFTGTCEAERAGDMEAFPVKAAKKEKPTRRGAAYVIRRADGAIWLQKRPPKGLLASMTEVPTTNWSDKREGERFDPATALEVAPHGHSFRKRVGQVTHTFTHFHLELDVYEAQSEEKNPMDQGWWSKPEELMGEALPTIFRKVVEIVR